MRLLSELNSSLSVGLGLLGMRFPALLVEGVYLVDLGGARLEAHLQLGKLLLVLLNEKLALGGVVLHSKL